MKPVFFLPHLGLGDHFTFNGALREIYKEHDYMVMPVKENNLKVVRRMFSDLNNLYLIPIGGSLDYSDTQHLTEANQLMNFYKNKKFTIKSMGYFNGHYDTSVKKYDELFYEQVGVNFKKRWESFSYPRNKENEQKLFKECFENLKEGEYVFLHDDPTRGRVIKKEHLPDLQIVTPHKKFWDADILDYRYLIENSFEIHCVNSSFSDLMDSFDLSKVKRLCIHEYARTGDPVHYKHNFEVIYN